MIRDADQILEYPWSTRTRSTRWTFGRVTLAGDAAHPMYPRGSNGAAQAAIDARTLADLLRITAMRATRSRPMRRLASARPPAWCAPTASIRPISSISRSRNWSAISPFDDLDKYISQAELRALSENYKRIAGFALADVSGGRN